MQLTQHVQVGIYLYMQRIIHVTEPKHRTHNHLPFLDVLISPIVSVGADASIISRLLS